MTAVNRGEGEDEECPLCLEPLPPFWDVGRQAMAVCCGKRVCKDCHSKRGEFLLRAMDDGSYGREERQLASACALCRARNPTRDNAGRIMIDRFEKGELPRNMYAMLGDYYMIGAHGLEQNVERSIEIWKLGAEKGDPHCQFSVGVGYDQGTAGWPKSIAKAKRWYLAATEQGHAIAEYNLALTMRDEGNDAEYVQYLRGSASKGYDKACYNLGVDYYEGSHGLQRSTKEAIRALTPAAERGQVQSMNLLGTVMRKPEPWIDPPVNPSFVKGMQWTRRAAESGDQRSISQLKYLEEMLSRKCFRCNKEAPPDQTFLRCSRCRAAWYCSKDCQVQHWKSAERGHKQYCVKWE